MRSGSELSQFLRVFPTYSSVQHLKMKYCVLTVNTKRRNYLMEIHNTLNSTGWRPVASVLIL